MKKKSEKIEITPEDFEILTYIKVSLFSIFHTDPPVEVLDLHDKASVAAIETFFKRLVQVSDPY